MTSHILDRPHPSTLSITFSRWQILRSKLASLKSLLSQISDPPLVGKSPPPPILLADLSTLRRTETLCDHYCAASTAIILSHPNLDSPNLIFALNPQISATPFPRRRHVHAPNPQIGPQFRIGIRISLGLVDDDKSMDVDDEIAPSSKRQAVQSASDPNKSSFGNPTYDGVIAGKVSGKRWKEVRTRRASSVHVSRKGTTEEQRAREKGIKKAYKERMNELKDEIKQNKQEKRRRREEREKQKEENTMRTGTKLQRITNPKTLKKIAKSKNRKLLKNVPDTVLNGASSKKSTNK